MNAQVKSIRLPSATFNRSLSILEAAEAKSLPNKVYAIFHILPFKNDLAEDIFEILQRSVASWKIAFVFVNPTKFTFVMDQSKKTNP